MTRTLAAMTLIILTLISHHSFAHSYEHNFKDEVTAIHYLLEEVGKSKVVFIRNGKEHSAKEAKEHLAYKMKMARRMFWFFGPKKNVTVQEFIEKIASRSSSSGKEYSVRLTDGKTLSTGDWLRAMLSKSLKTGDKPTK